MRTLVAFLLLSELAFAAEVCVVVPAPAVPRVARQAVAYTLIAQAGQDQAPYSYHSQNGQVVQVSQTLDDRICLQDPTIDLVTVVTDATMAAEYATQESARQASEATEQARQQAFLDEVVSNDFCSGELTAVKTSVDAQIDAWVTARQSEVNATTNFNMLKVALRDQTLPAIGQAMKTGLKKVVGCVRARAR